MNKAIYRAKDEWVLCTCNTCGSLNYVEPHGTTAECRKCQKNTKHANIPYEYRDMSGTRLIRKPNKTARLNLAVDLEKMAESILFPGGKR